MPAFSARFDCNSLFLEFFFGFDAINATLEYPSFRTRSEVAADALKSAQTLKNWYKSETNRTFLASFSAER